jgi:hypothetical protein
MIARIDECKGAAAALTEKAVALGLQVRAKYGPNIGWTELQKILVDRDLVHFPCQIRFDGEPLLPGESAHTVASGEQPQDGYTIFVHPSYESRPSEVAYVALCQLAFINFGPAATIEDAEKLGSGALGLTQDEYFHALCKLSDSLGGDDLC